MLDLPYVTRTIVITKRIHNETEYEHLSDDCRSTEDTVIIVLTNIFKATYVEQIFFYEKYAHVICIQ